MWQSRICIQGVGRIGAEEEALKMDFGENKKAEKGHRAWLYIVREIAYMPILQPLFAADSPSKGWNIFKKPYASRNEEKSSLLRS